MRRKKSLWGRFALSATLALTAVMVAAPAIAETTSTSWDFSSPPGERVIVGTEVEIGSITLPDPEGSECTATVEASNGSSIHPGHNINVYLNGVLLMTLEGIEDAPFKFSSDTAGFIASASDTLTVQFLATIDRVTSSEGNLTVTCTPPPPPGGGEGCTPGYWKQAHHFDSWLGYTPGDSFDATFGVASSFDTLLDGLKAKGGQENALARHAVAALLNSATGGVDYEYSTAEVIAIVQDAYASGDYETAKDLLAAENEMGCPLN